MAIYKEGFIYCIEHVAGYIKIGFSTNPFQRAVSLLSSPESRWPPCGRDEIKLVGLLPGTLQQELAIHKTFQNYSVNGGEWYPKSSPPSEWFFSQDFVPYNGEQPFYAPRTEKDWEGPKDPQISIQQALSVAAVSQLAKALAEKREPAQRKGGRKPTCLCGTCRKCKKRLSVQQTRQKQKQGSSG